MGREIEFGVVTFGDVSVGEDGKPLSHARVIRNIVEQGLLAEQAGIDFFGIGEHHREDFAASAPEIVLATIGGKTSRIRLSTAATVLSCDDPVRLFQRFSILNAITKGRAEIVVGRGWFTEPFSLFGFDLKEYDDLFEDKLRLLSILSHNKVTSWKGKGRPALNSQRIFPPLEDGKLNVWVAVGSTPNSVLRAARYDMPMILSVIGGEAQRFTPLIALYRQAFAKLGKPVREIGIHSNGYVAETDEIAREEYWQYYKTLRDRIGAERGWSPFSKEMFAAEVDRGSLYVGSPRTVADRISLTLKQLGATRFDLKYSAGALPHGKMLKTIELFGTKVIPIVRDLAKGSETDDA